MDLKDSVGGKLTYLLTIIRGWEDSVKCVNNIVNVVSSVDDSAENVLHMLKYNLYSFFAKRSLFKGCTTNNIQPITYFNIIYFATKD